MVTANGAHAAIREFLLLDPRPSIVLTDVVMPGISGPVMIDSLLSLEPDLKVIFMSGYAETELVQRIVDKGFSLIAKPFTLVRLRECIKQALAGSPMIDPPTQ